jgi:hypothetical protein
MVFSSSPSSMALSFVLVIFFIILLLTGRMSHLTVQEFLLFHVQPQCQRTCTCSVYLLVLYHAAHLTPKYDKVEIEGSSPSFVL